MRLPTLSLPWGAIVKFFLGTVWDSRSSVYRICLDIDNPILDLREVLPDWRTDSERARAHVWAMIDIFLAVTQALFFASGNLPLRHLRCSQFILGLNRTFFLHFIGGSQRNGSLILENAEAHAIFSTAPLAGLSRGARY